MNGNGLHERVHVHPISQTTSALSQLFSNSHVIPSGYRRGANLTPTSNINSIGINNNVANSQFIDNNIYIIQNYTQGVTSESDNTSFTSSISMESLLSYAPTNNIQKRRRYHTISTSSEEG